MNRIAAGFFAASAVVGLISFGLLLRRDAQSDRREREEVPAAEVPGFGRATSVCLDGFRLYLADREQTGYAAAVIADPVCATEGGRR